VNIPDQVRSSILKAMQDAKLNAIDELLKMFQSRIPEKLEVIPQIRDLMLEYKSDIERWHINDSNKKKVKGERKRRAHTAYNQFIGQRMKELKSEMQGVSSKELMKVAMESWKELPDSEKMKLKSEFNANSV